MCVTMSQRKLPTQLKLQDKCTSKANTKKTLASENRKFPLCLRFLVIISHQGKEQLAPAAWPGQRRLSYTGSLFSAGFRTLGVVVFSLALNGMQLAARLQVLLWLQDPEFTEAYLGRLWRLQLAYTFNPNRVFEHGFMLKPPAICEAVASWFHELGV